MRITVCVRHGTDGELNPFDACAYEEALKIKGAEVTLLSMGPAADKERLLRLTRLGAKKAILLSDKAFAGADTLATAYALSLAVKKLCPELIFCGRQTLIGDTAQTGPMLSVLSNTAFIAGVMSIDSIDEKISCTTRDMGVKSAPFPALLAIERINTLRLPSIMSKLGEVEIWSASDIGADVSRCGLAGSPTRVLKTFENSSGKRKCKFITANELKYAIDEGIKKSAETVVSENNSSKKLPRVCIVSDAPRAFSKSISDDITVIPLTNENDIAQQITELQPNAVIWGSDTLSKTISAKVAAMLSLGLCADCTRLETDGKKLYMYRPALSGSVIAEIESKTLPAMATVRTVQNASDTVVSAGFGAKDSLDAVKAFADKLCADMATTRKAVDNDILPYRLQVGLTGKTVSPPVYIAIGISGAVHHIAGMQRSGTVIAINSDKNAPIFEYADYGIVGDIEEILELY